jgi:sugar phosphate permease
METTTSDSSQQAIEEALYRKVAWRLIPLLLACYVVAYLDRVNVGFAKLQMIDQLGFSDTFYGLGGMVLVPVCFLSVISCLKYRVT